MDAEREYAEAPEAHASGVPPRTRYEEDAAASRAAEAPEVTAFREAYEAELRRARMSRPEYLLAELEACRHDLNRALNALKLLSSRPRGLPEPP